MQVQKEVRKNKGSKAAVKRAASSGVGADAADVDNAKKSGGAVVDKRGELIEQNQDGLEYSSDENRGDDDDGGLDEAMQNMAKKGKGKEVKGVDHNKVDYKDFDKDFYREVRERI